MNPMMQKVFAFFETIIQGIDPVPYSTVKASLESLKAAIKQAGVDDDQDAQGFHVELDRLRSHGLDVLSERTRFTAQANAIKAKAAMWGVITEIFCAAYVGKYEDVPRQLEAERDAWNKRALAVQRISTQAKSVRYIEGWEGSAADNYSVAVGVQIAGLEELKGVMTSTSQGADAAALIHGGLFGAVNDLIQTAIGTIQSSPGTNGSQYYLRTATACQVCDDLVKQFQRVADGSLAAGAMAELSNECSRTLDMPLLLSASQWPTGTSAAGVIPADTGSGVTSDGNTGVHGPGGSGSGSDTGVTL